jgi:hypothetical protein
MLRYFWRNVRCARRPQVFPQLTDIIDFLDVPKNAIPFAEAFGRHINILPIFMPGAGGSTAINNAGNVAEPDGLTIVSPLKGAVAAQAIGVPANIVAALRDAFDETMKDSGYVEKLQKAKVQFNPMTGQQLGQLVQKTLGTSKSVIERYKIAIN